MSSAELVCIAVVTAVFMTMLLGTSVAHTHFKIECVKAGMEYVDGDCRKATK